VRTPPGATPYSEAAADGTESTALTVEGAVAVAAGGGGGVFASKGGALALTVGRCRLKPTFASTE